MSPYVMPAELRGGSDTRRRKAADALSVDMRSGTFPFLRERQWLTLSSGGEIITAPACYQHPLLDLAGARS